MFMSVVGQIFAQQLLDKSMLFASFDKDTSTGASGIDLT
jgi:hypothetical protein